MQYEQQARIDVAPFDLHATMAMQHLGRFDPTGRRGADWFAKVHLDGEERPVTWQFRTTASGLDVTVAGADDGALSHFVSRFPLDDGASAFDPCHPVLERLARAYTGLRLMPVPWTFDVAAGAVLQQRVRWQVAYTDFARIARRWGTPTPAGIAFPSARQLAAVPACALEAAGIDGKRARALHALARAEAQRPFLRPETGLGAVRLRLLRIPGIGPWTANTITGYALGDTDAVPVGDLHLPSIVTSALAGEAEGTDARMLELLEPCRGQRFRAVRLICWAARRAPHLLRAPAVRA
ncbi:MAG TPA: hypothetical protein VK929_03420 [Longimicrobiales bacterium]|nr:hypothetical protein [Longimicrobiales bacterium]